METKLNDLHLDITIGELTSLPTSNDFNQIAPIDNFCKTPESNVEVPPKDPCPNEIPLLEDKRVYRGIENSPLLIMQTNNEQGECVCQALQLQGNMVSKSNPKTKSEEINEYLSIRQTKKDKIEQMVVNHSGSIQDRPKLILKEYYNEFCRDGQSIHSNQEKHLASNVNQNSNDDGTTLLKASDSIGEATVLDNDEICDLEPERARPCRTKVKRRTSSTIRKIQEMIQEEQLKDLRGKSYHEGSLPRHPITKTAVLSYKNAYRQRSKSRSKFAKSNSDQAYRPFRRWLGVSTCIASDTRFIVHPGKAAEQKWKDTKIAFENNAIDRNICHYLMPAESDKSEELASTSNSFENRNQGKDIKIKNNKIIKSGRDKTTKFKDARLVESANVSKAQEPKIKIINVKDNGSEKDKCTDNACECTSKQIVNVEGNEGVIHIHQQSHGTVGNMTTKGGPSNRDSTGSQALSRSDSEDDSKSSTFKALRKKLKKSQRKQQYITVQAIKDCEGKFPGQLSFKKGQLIKQTNINQNPVDGICYGYYRAGKLQRKVWGIYPSSLVVTHTEKKEEITSGDVIEVTEKEKKN